MIAALLVWLLLSPPATAEPDPAPAQGPAPAAEPQEALPPLRTVTREELEALVTRLLPLVEEAAGRRFLHRPEIVPTDPASLSRVFYREQMHLLGRLSELDLDEAHEMARATAGEITSAFVGKYGFLDKRLYVMAEGVSLALAGRGLPPELVDEVLQVVLAHELAHALQDQHTDLGHVVGNRPDGDAIMAVNCVVEGHAVWVHEQVARKLGYDRAVRVVAAIQGYDPDRADAPVDPRRLYTSYVYGRGRAFVDWHARDGGHDRLWTLLAHPPAASAMILAPATYAAELEPAVGPGVRVALRRVIDQVADPSWPVREERVGDYDLREQLADRGNDVALADGVAGAWQARAAGREAMEGVEVRVLRFHGPDGARAWVDRMRSRAQAQLDMLLPPLAAEAPVGFLGRVDRFEALDSDLSARESLVIELEGRRQELGTLWVARGSDVVQVVTVNRPVPDRRMARALRRLFAALD